MHPVTGPQGESAPGASPDTWPGGARPFTSGPAETDADGFYVSPPQPGPSKALIGVIGAGVAVMAIGVGWSIFGPEKAPAQPPARPAPNFMTEQTQLMREAVQMAREAHEMQKQHMENMQRMMQEAEGYPTEEGGD